MKLITWNIDGLDKTSETINRTNRAIKIMKEYDIIFVQEVTANTNHLIWTQMKEYFFYPGIAPNTWNGYHVAILLKKSIVKNGDLRMVKTPDFVRFNPITTYTPFINSTMGRGVLCTAFTSIDEKRHACS